MPNLFPNKTNNYHDKPKNSSIDTPPRVANFLYSLFKPMIDKGQIKNIYDPCVGNMKLVAPFMQDTQCQVYGSDIANHPYIDFLDNDQMEDWVQTFEDKNIDIDLVLCNPPFNGAPGKKLYPELFLQQILKYFPQAPIVLFAPMGFRLNQRTNSKRWQWLRDNCPDIDTIISLPLDIFEGVEFHSEILIFNSPYFKPHLFLPH